MCQSIWRYEVRALYKLFYPDLLIPNRTVYWSTHNCAREKKRPNKNYQHFSNFIQVISRNKSNSFNMADDKKVSITFARKHDGKNFIEKICFQKKFRTWKCDAVCGVRLCFTFCLKQPRHVNKRHIVKYNKKKITSSTFINGIALFRVIHVISIEFLEMFTEKLWHKYWFLQKKNRNVGFLWFVCVGLKGWRIRAYQLEGSWTRQRCCSV